MKNTHILFVKKLDNIRNFNSLTIGNRARESSPHGAFFEISHCIIYLEGVFLFKCIGLHSIASPQTASYPFKNHAMSQPHNNPPLHVQKGRNFLCKNRLKIWCSNYIKKFVEMSCFFNAYKRLSLKSYAKESSQYGAISHVFNFRKLPAVFAIHTIFAVLKIGMERNCL